MSLQAIAPRQARKDRRQANKPAKSQAEVSLANLSRQEVVFQIDNKDAKEVLLAGNFTEWEKAPIRMLNMGNGSWQSKINLAPGRYLYKFLVDGRWETDPKGRERSANPFGTADSVLVVS